MTDDKIRRRWLRARRMYHSGSVLQRRLAMLDIEKLEQAGVTTEDIDRLFLPTPIQILRDEFVAPEV